MLTERPADDDLQYPVVLTREAELMCAAQWGRLIAGNDEFSATGGAG